MPPISKCSFHGGHLEFCMIMMSNKCIVCFIAFLDCENIRFGEIILSLSKLLTTICSLQLFHGGHFEFCMLMMSNKCIICFIVFLDIEHIYIWFGEIILSLSQLLMIRGF